jgi:hypothetical protein
VLALTTATVIRSHIRPACDAASKTVKGADRPCWYNLAEHDSSLLLTSRFLLCCGCCAVVADIAVASTATGCCCFCIWCTHVQPGPAAQGDLQVTCCHCCRQLKRSCCCYHRMHAITHLYNTMLWLCVVQHLARPLANLICASCLLPTCHTDPLICPNCCACRRRSFRRVLVSADFANSAVRC